MSKLRFEIAARDRFHNLCGESVSVGAGLIESRGQSDTGLAVVSLIENTVKVGDVLEKDDVLEIDGDIDLSALLGAPILAALLQIAEDAKVELGTAVVISGDCPLSKLFGEMCRWWTPVRIQLSKFDDSIDSSGPFSQVFRVSDENVQKELADLLQSSAAVSFVDFSGSSDAWDIMFEAAPYWSRLVAAAAVGSPMTIDFYNNIHRKGVTLIGKSITVDRLFTSPGCLFTERQLSAAVAILRSPSETARLISYLSA